MLIVNQGYSQINYSIKVESGFLKYQYNMIDTFKSLLTQVQIGKDTIWTMKMALTLTS
jgi:hypothetical protein